MGTAELSLKERYPPRSPERERLAKRTIRTLQLGVVPGGLGMTSSFSAAALLGNQMTGSETKASLAAVCLSIGGTLAGIPLAALMARYGRRVGIRTGYMTGLVGATLAFLSTFTGRYSLLVAGMVLVGAGQAANLASRFAGADLATDQNRAQAISLVLWASTVGSVLGPTIALGTKGLFSDGDSLVGFAIPYGIAMVLFAVAALTVDRRLRPDPLHVVATDAGATGIKLPSLAEAGRIFSHPVAAVALLAMMFGQAVMVGIMTVSPIHMEHGGQGGGIIGIMLSLHIAGMFAFSPYFGWLTDRITGEAMILIGSAVLVIGALVAANTDAHHAAGHLWGLFAIGVGWSCCMVAGSAMLTASFSVDQRVGVQATADVLMTALGAMAGVTSGLAVEARSYAELSIWGAWLSLLLGAIGLVALVRRLRVGRPTAAA